MRRWTLALLLLVGPGFASATVFHSKQSAFAEAFPAGAEIEQRNLYLDGADVEYIRANSGLRWDKRLANVYVAKVAGAVVGYGYFDTHRVRTLNETVFVVVRPDGHLERVMQVAFHEPNEYRAPQRWLAQFAGRELDASLALRSQVDGLSGATMTARSITAHVRATLALHQRKVAKRAS